MPQPATILRTITWLPPGGIERKILAVLPRLDPGRFRPRVVCLRERGALADELERAGIPVEVIPFRSRLDPRGLGRLARYMRQNGIRLAHAHMYRASVPTTIAARLAGGVPVLAQVHNVGVWETRRQAWMDRFLMRWRKALIAVSEPVRADAIRTLGLRPERVRVIYNGVDLDEFRPAADRAEAKRASGFDADSVVVLMAARLVTQKNPLGFLEAARRLSPRHAQALFAIAGGGPLEDELRRTASDAGMEGRFLLLGHRDPMAAVYRAADVFVLPSYKEGFSNALIEAMACGLPVVAADVGGAREALAGSAAGALVPAGDLDALEREIGAFLSDSGKRRMAGEAARERSRRFSLERMIADVEALYDEALGQGAP
ncbi:MAG: putative glycosyltransferase EpsF [candidate division BRC1 bacterium ADurb.BinA364]|nr:MAG: putative glycosyltransferase EpsF [candidate division BRC1 bacterium ADurb.BinA364]